MDLEFYKLQTAGNDLILVNPPTGSITAGETASETARLLCRRDYGAGGNGLVVINDCGSSTAAASFFLSDGSMPPFPNDAAFCLARFLFDTGFAGKDDFRLEINGKGFDIGIIDSGHFRLCLGEPMDGSLEPLREDPEREYACIIQSGGTGIPATPLFLQKHGLVIFTENRSLDQLRKISDGLDAGLPRSPVYRKVFCRLNDRDDMDVLVMNNKRDDITSSCAMAAVASVVNGFADREATVTHKRGEYYFQWLSGSNQVYMTGSADYIYTGSIFLDI